MARVADRARPCTRRRRTGGPRRAPWTPAGRSRRSRPARAGTPRSGPRATRRARRTPRWPRRAPGRARPRTPRRGPRARPPPGCCARSACARRPACPAARAPARRSRWPAPRRRRTTAARPAAPGAARRPPPTVRPRARRRAARAARPARRRRCPPPGGPAVSETALITATGRSPAAAASGADSMSASSAPSAASSARSDRRTRWSTVVIRPGPGGQPGPAQLAGQQRSATGTVATARPRCRRPGRPGRGRRSARRRPPSRPAGRTGWLSAHPHGQPPAWCRSRCAYLADGSALAPQPAPDRAGLDAHGGTDDRVGHRVASVYVAAERADGEGQPVQVVVDVEVAGEAGAGEPRLVPGAVVAFACSASQRMPRSVAGARPARPPRAGRAAPRRSATRWTRPVRPAPGRRRSAGPRPSRRPAFWCCSSQATARRMAGLPGFTPAAISAGTTAPVP